MQPGESKEVTILLTWINREDNMGLKVNVAEISKDYNEYGSPDIDSTPNNKVPGEDDIDDAPVMLTVTTGEKVMYLGIYIAVLAVLAGGIAVWKKTLKASLDDTKKVEELSKAQENYNQKLQETNDLKKKAKEYEEYRINGKTRADLTAAQMEEEQSLAKELVDTYPSLLDYIDKEGKYHLKNAEAIQEEIKKKENLTNISKNSYLQLRKTYARQGIFTDTSTLAGQAINNLQNFASAFGTEKLNKNSELKRIANKIENAGGESFNKSGFYNIMEAFAKGEKFSLSNEDFSDMFAGDISQGNWEKLLENIEKTGNNIIDETGKVNETAFKNALEATGAYSGSNAEKVTNQFINLNKELGGLYGQLLKGAATEQSSIYVEKAQMQVNEFDLQGSISEDLNSAISKSIVATAKGNYTDEEWIQLGDKRDTFIDNTAEQYRVAIEKLNKTQLANLDKMVNETSKMGRNIIRTVNTPKDIEQLRKYIDAHYEVEKDSISKIVRRADADLRLHRNIFKDIKTIFTKK